MILNTDIQDINVKKIQKNICTFLNDLTEDNGKIKELINYLKNIDAFNKKKDVSAKIQEDILEKISQIYNFELIEQLLNGSLFLDYLFTNKEYTKILQKWRDARAKYYNDLNRSVRESSDLAKNKDIIEILNANIFLQMPTRIHMPISELLGTMEKNKDKFSEKYFNYVKKLYFKTKLYIRILNIFINLEKKDILNAHSLSILKIMINNIIILKINLK